MSIFEVRTEIARYEAERTHLANRLSVVDDVLMGLRCAAHRYDSMTCDGHIPSQRSFENRSDPDRPDRDAPADLEDSAQ